MSILLASYGGARTIFFVSAFVQLSRSEMMLITFELGALCRRGRKAWGGHDGGEVDAKHGVVGLAERCRRGI